MLVVKSRGGGHNVVLELLLYNVVANLCLFVGKAVQSRQVVAVVMLEWCMSC